jgi:hypothetical protein
VKSTTLLKEQTSLLLAQLENTVVAAPPAKTTGSGRPLRKRVSFSANIVAITDRKVLTLPWSISTDSPSLSPSQSAGHDLEGSGLGSTSSFSGLASDMPSTTNALNRGTRSAANVVSSHHHSDETQMTQDPEESLRVTYDDPQEAAQRETVMRMLGAGRRVTTAAGPATASDENQGSPAAVTRSAKRRLLQDGRRGGGAGEESQQQSDAVTPVKRTRKATRRGA